MAGNYFHLVPRVVTSEKWFDVSIDEIVRTFYGGGRIEVPADHEVDDGEGGAEMVPLRLKVSGVHKYSESWDIALLMHNERIDGFGWEEVFKDVNGNVMSGWHRHIWRPATQNAKAKLSVACFDGAQAVEHFVIRGLTEMNIVFNRRDNGNRDLF